MTNKDDKDDKSNMILIKDFFFPDKVRTADFAAEYRALSEEEREQLGEGIRNGSLTY